MGYVEVDFSSVGARAHARRPVPTPSGGDDGDVDWNSIDFDRVCHRVEVTTAAVRGAGTSGRVELTFYGDKGVSKPIPLEYDPGAGPGFMRGATLPFRVVDYGGDVGALSKVEVRLIPELSQVGHGWMLEHISVTDEEKGEELDVQVRKWFGESDCGGASGPLRQLLAASEDPRPETRRLRRGPREPPARQPAGGHGRGACVPHADKTKEGARARMQRECGHAGEDAYFVGAPRRKKRDGRGGRVRRLRGGGWRVHVAPHGHRRRFVLAPAHGRRVRGVRGDRGAETETETGFWGTDVDGKREILAPRRCCGRRSRRSPPRASRGAPRRASPRSTPRTA